MCKCTPEIRTPWCGKPGCEIPEQSYSLTRVKEWLKWSKFALETGLEPKISQAPLADMEKIIAAAEMAFKIVDEARALNAVFDDLWPLQRSLQNFDLLMRKENE